MSVIMDGAGSSAMDVLFFASSSELRAWLAENHDKVSELLIGFHKKSSGRGGITYQEAVDQALCFGWIDGIRKSIDDESYTTRFTPRRTRSNWSQVNIKRVGELTELGLMHPAGLKAFQERDPARENQYSNENRDRALDQAYEDQFRANEPAWAFFQSQPPSYRRVATWWVISAKKEETRLKRLAILIDDSANGRRLAVTRPQKAQER